MTNMYKSEVMGKGGIEAKVVADSIANGVRITTMELRYHRFIHGEFLTHRLFSRNSSSSRAIPVTKMINQVEKDPAMPIHWGKNQAGMKADEELVHPLKYTSSSRESEWIEAARDAVIHADTFSIAGYHKQIVNRLLEPFQFIKTVVTATEWDNFFKLRNHKDAQPEIQELARCMEKALEQSTPNVLGVGEWHIPYVTQADLPASGCINHYQAQSDAIKCSAARCARVSYQKHDNTAPSVEDDIELYNQLVTRPFTDKRGNVLGEDDPIHCSPLEHQATPMSYPYDSYWDGEDNWEKGVTHIDKNKIMWSGNFKSWIQYRKLIGG